MNEGLSSRRRDTESATLRLTHPSEWAEMTRRSFSFGFSAALAGTAKAQTKYSGPRPSQKDLPYLLEAQRLIATEPEPATESKSKEGKGFSVPGTSSSARTPLPEPIFLLAPGKINAEQLALYRLQVNNGQREAVLNQPSDDEDNPEDLRLTLRILDQGLYRIEASHMLDPGEYALKAPNNNTAFCFTVY